MTLQMVLGVLGYTTVEVVDSDTGEILCEHCEAATLIALFEDTFKYPGDWYWAEVEDMNIYNNVLTICIYIEKDDEE